MPSEISQEPRLLQLQVSGFDGVVLRSVNVTEAISQCFVARAEIVALDKSISSEDLLGRAATLVIRRPGPVAERKFRGIVSLFRDLGRIHTEHRCYEIEVVPAFRKLAWRSNCRVFQGQSITAIVSTLAGEVGASAPLTGSAPTEVPSRKWWEIVLA